MTTLTYQLRDATEVKDSINEASYVHRYITARLLLV